MNKVLILRFSSLGDIVLTSLLVRCLKLQSGAEVHFLTKETFRALIEANPYIDKCYSIKKSVGEITGDLVREKYDLIIDLHKNIRSMRIRWSLWNIPVVSYHKANFEKWIMVYFKRNILPSTHLAERYLASLKNKNIQNDGMGLDYFIPDIDKVNIKTEFGITENYIALVIGATHYTKRLPPDRLKILVHLLSKKSAVILIGGKAESEISNGLLGDHIFNACGRYSLNQSASILDQSSMVVSHDTGMLHIAAALKRPLRSIFGATLSEYGFWPYYGANSPDKNISFSVPNLKCRPCTRFGSDHCPRGHFQCMRDQDLEGIVESV